MQRIFLLCFLLSSCALFSVINAMPQPQQQDNQAPMPYEHSWEVNQADTPPHGDPLFMSHRESRAEGSDQTDGEWRVLYANGRLMIVTYFVKGNSGTNQKITWIDNFQPNSATGKKKK